MVLTKYAEAKTIQIHFYNPDTQRLQDAITWSPGDVKIIKDGGASANIGTLPTLIAGTKTWKVTLTSLELTGAQITLEFADQDGPVFVDDTVTFQTYGNASAFIPSLPASLADGGIAIAELNNIADAILKRDFSLLTGEASRSMLNALRAIRNKTSVSGGLLVVTKENDSTVAWQGAVTSDPNAEPITGVDPT